MPVYIVGFEQFLEKGILPDDEWEAIKRQEAQKIHAGIMRKASRADEDPWVKFDYTKNWRTAHLPQGKVFGSDYDYWNYVVDDALGLWGQWAGQITRDYVAEAKGGMAKGSSIPFYAHPLQVWQNRRPVAPSERLEGPQIDIGPTADFSVFLESWNYSKKKSIPLKLFWNIGVMHAIARQLSDDYRGLHTVFAMPIRPNDRSEIREIPNRQEPILTLPIIRILPRHYSRGL